MGVFWDRCARSIITESKEITLSDVLNNNIIMETAERNIYLNLGCLDKHYDMPVLLNFWLVVCCDSKSSLRKIDSRHCTV